MSDESYCALHGVEMRRWEKDGRVWYSHKADDGTWCKGGVAPSGQRPVATQTAPAPAPQAAPSNGNGHHAMDDATIWRITMLSCLSSAAAFLHGGADATGDTVYTLAEGWCARVLAGPKPPMPQMPAESNDPQTGKPSWVVLQRQMSYSFGQSFAMVELAFKKLFEATGLPEWGQRGEVWALVWDYCNQTPAAAR